MKRIVEARRRHRDEFVAFQRSVDEVLRGLPGAHYPYGFDTIGHLGLIYLATAIFVVGALLALRGLREARS